MDAPYALLETLEPGIARLLAHNPSPFTFTGTQTYFAGEDEVVVVDPGPDLPEHVAAIVAAIGGRRVVAIACTHTHRDHSPASRALAAATGAPIIGCAALALDSVGPRADASFDFDYQPDRVLAMARRSRSTAMRSSRSRPRAIRPTICASPIAGRCSAATMSWAGRPRWWCRPTATWAPIWRASTSLRQRDDRIYYPAHGAAVTKPQQLLRGMIGHRMQRERQILRRVEAGDRTVPEIVAAAYPGLDPRLVRRGGGIGHRAFAGPCAARAR